MPIVDAILGVAYAYAIKETIDDSEEFGSGHIAMFAFPVGLFGSSVQGFRRIKACKEFLATPVPADTTGLAEALSWPISFRGAPPLSLVRPMLPEAAKLPPSKTTRGR